MHACSKQEILVSTSQEVGGGGEREREGCGREMVGLGEGGERENDCRWQERALYWSLELCGQFLKI